MNYEWPGNVRELQNLVEQAFVGQRGKVLDIYPGVSKAPEFAKTLTADTASQGFEIKSVFDIDDIKDEKDKLERAYLLKALNENNWRVSGKDGVARLLKMNPSTLESRMRKLDIKR